MKQGEFSYTAGPYHDVVKAPEIEGHLSSRSECKQGMRKVNATVLGNGASAGVSELVFTQPCLHRRFMELRRSGMAQDQQVFIDHEHLWRLCNQATTPNQVYFTK